jgi:hypothetical protein
LPRRPLDRWPSIHTEDLDIRGRADGGASLPASALDDERDREELRQRYYGLLQELRVLLPGVQVLAAFLLTAPLASRFTELDQTSRVVYGVSLMSALCSVVCFVAPTAFHRMGARTSRSQRLAWAIQMTRAGLVFMAVALESALFVICRLIFNDTIAVIMVAGLGITMIAVWLVVPAIGLRGHQPGDRAA